jgi:uncharacterized membrane protein
MKHFLVILSVFALLGCSASVVAPEPQTTTQSMLVTEWNSITITADSIYQTGDIYAMYHGRLISIDGKHSVHFKRVSVSSDTVKCSFQGMENDVLEIIMELNDSNMPVF